MTLVRTPLGLAAAAICALIFACTTPVGMDRSETDQRAGNGAPGDGSNADGSGANGTGVGQKTTTGLPCAVSEVLSKNCQTCHAEAPKSGASTSLVTWDDLQKDQGGKKLFEVVKDRIHAETGRMPPAARLTDGEIKSIDDWVGGGAKPAGDTCNVGDGPPPATRPFVCNAPAKATVLKAASPFKWTDETKADQYMCFGVDEIVGSKKHAIAMGPKIENLNIVHHVLLFQSQNAMSNEATPCTATTSAAWKLITGWAPGGGNFDLPSEAGYPIERGTTHWVLQVHYNNATGKHSGETDNSGYQICESDQLRSNDAGTLAFGSQNFTIPPRTAKYTIRCDYKLGGNYKGVKFFGASPHMHTRGISIATERLVGGTGTPELIFGQTPFSFENQQNFKIDKHVEPGDVMRTRCTWKNPGDTAITWGENTSDEMCFNFMMYYPAIPDQTIGPVPIQTWISPSLETPFIGVNCVEEK